MLSYNLIENKKKHVNLLRYRNGRHFFLENDIITVFIGKAEGAPEHCTLILICKIESNCSKKGIINYERRSGEALPPPLHFSGFEICGGFLHFDCIKV